MEFDYDGLAFSDTPKTRQDTLNPTTSYLKKNAFNNLKSVPTRLIYASSNLEKKSSLINQAYNYSSWSSLTHNQQSGKTAKQLADENLENKFSNFLFLVYFLLQIVKIIYISASTFRHTTKFNSFSKFNNYSSQNLNENLNCLSKLEILEAATIGISHIMLVLDTLPAFACDFW